MKGFRIREEMNGVDEPPGKTWFWELEAGVIDADRCIQCGTCVAVCPSNSIGVNEDTGLARAGQDVHRLLAVLGLLPPRGLRYEALWPPVDARPPRRREAPVVVKADAADTYWKITGGPPGDGLGAVIGAATPSGPASRPDDAQDGGVVTAMLLAAAGRRATSTAPWCRGRATTPTSRGRGSPPWPPRPRRSSTAAGSYYNQTMALAELDLSRYDLPAKPRLAVVGHAVRDPGDPGHAGAPVADRGPPDRRRGAHHRPAVHQELRLRGADAP